MMGLEEIYRCFYLQNLENMSPDEVDFIGLNLSEDSFDFKIYERVKGRMETESPFLSELYYRDMLRCCNKVRDTVNTDCLRYEIGLGNRNNDNMKWLLKRMCRMFPGLETYQKEIRQMCGMHISENPAYQLSSLYFLGVIEKKEGLQESLQALKLHYLTRICEDTDHIGRNYQFEDIYYLNCLHDMGVPELSRLTDAARSFLENDKDIHLWMAAADYFLAGKCKYKIYFKNMTVKSGEMMSDWLEYVQQERLKSRLESTCKWMHGQETLHLYGAAICLDTREKWSLNFYFKYKTD